jgi:hypothetical protein
MDRAQAGQVCAVEIHAELVARAPLYGELAATQFLATSGRSFFWFGSFSWFAHSGLSLYQLPPSAGDAVR